MDISERVEIVTYQCVDGFVRTRCMDHVAERGDFAPVHWKAPLRRAMEPRRRCVECYRAWFELGHALPPADGE